jgi:hypothetical protein
MWNRWVRPRNCWSLPCPLQRVCVIAYLVFLLGVGEPVNVCGLVHAHWLLAASERVVLAEESSDTELAAPRSSTHPRPRRKQVPLPVPHRVVRAQRDSDPALPPALYRLSLRQPNLPCGVTVPIRC